MSTSMTVEQYIAKQPDYDKRRRWLRPLLQRIVHIIAKVEATGMENVPDNGNCMLMMNHISLLDPIVCTTEIQNRYVISMSKAENADNPIFKWFIDLWGGYFINRGEIDRKALTNTIELIKSGQLVLMAPEGTRHPEGLAPAKDGMAYVAAKADAIIIPATIAGAQDWLKRLKRLRRGYARVNFGRPFRFKTGGRKRIPRDELALMMQEAMYQLALAIPEEFEEFRGAYRGC